MARRIETLPADALALGGTQKGVESARLRLHVPLTEARYEHAAGTLVQLEAATLGCEEVVALLIVHL